MPKKKAIDFRIMGNAEIPFECVCPYCKNNVYGEICDDEIGFIIDYECVSCGKTFTINTKK
jgi:hypothetical protein